MSGRIALIPDGWLSEQLGKSAFRLEDKFSEFSELDLTDHCAFVWAKVAISRSETLLVLQKQGFQLVELSCQYSGRPSFAPDTKHSALIRSAVDADQRDIMRIAARELTQNRFHKDPRIPNDVAKKIREQWVVSYFNGVRGDRMFVAVVRGKVSGFCLVVSRPTELIIDLIAVDRESQNRGIARDLIQYAWEHRQPGVEKVGAGTQLLNQPSTTLYDRVGLKRVNTYFLLHYHFEREET